MRGSLIALLALCGLLAGCSTITAGRAVPADNNGPVPVKDSALKSALLDADEINEIMGTSGMSSQRTSDELMSDDTDFDSSCLGAWQPIQESVYQDSGYSASQMQQLYETSPAGDRHVVWEAAVTFESRADASAFFDQSSEEWTSCGDRTFTTTGSSSYTWELSAPENQDSTLTMTQTQEDADGWSCQHALRLSNNVIIDVVACMTGSDDEAKQIAEGIDEKLPSI